MHVTFSSKPWKSGGSLIVVIPIELAAAIGATEKKNIYMRASENGTIIIATTEKKLRD